MSADTSNPRPKNVQTAKRKGRPLLVPPTPYPQLYFWSGRPCIAPTSAVVSWDFVMGCSWDSIGPHGIFNGIYGILWDVVYGFQGISWDFHGFCTHLSEKHMLLSPVMLKRLDQRQTKKLSGSSLRASSRLEPLHSVLMGSQWALNEVPNDSPMAAGGSIFLIARPPAFQVVLRHGLTWLDMAPSHVEPCGVFLSLSSPFNLPDSPSPVIRNSANIGTKEHHSIANLRR